MTVQLPFLVEPTLLADRLTDADLLLVDLRSPDNFIQGHIPGAVNLNYVQIVRSASPVGGLLPEEADLSRVLAAIGLRDNHHVVAYDDEGGGRAGRLLWTLDCLGHNGLSLLNGGLHAWVSEGRPLEPGTAQAMPSDYQAAIRRPQVIADRNYILRRLGEADLQLLDVRSLAEFTGDDVRSARGGHIPGAINLDWLNTIDRSQALRFKGDAELRGMLEDRGITPDKEIVIYCQTHHRSSHTYTVLRHLGYPRIRGYPGAWSDWGNQPDTPIEC